jgi:N-acetyltransferase
VKQIEKKFSAANDATQAAFAEFDLQPVLAGPALTLRPLQSEDFDILYAAASDPLIWEQNPEPTRFQRPVFTKFFNSAIASKGAFIVLDNATNSVVGSSRYYDWNPGKREVAIGYTFLARSHWGGAANREMKTLMLDHAFKWARVVWFHIGHNNIRSRKAMEKIGGEYSHNAPTELNGVMHDYAFYKIVKPNAIAAT